MKSVFSQRGDHTARGKQHAVQPRCPPVGPEGFRLNPPFLYFKIVFVLLFPVFRVIVKRSYLLLLFSVNVVDFSEIVRPIRGVSGGFTLWCMISVVCVVPVCIFLFIN